MNYTDFCVDFDVETKKIENTLTFAILFFIFAISKLLLACFAYNASIIANIVQK